MQFISTSVHLKDVIVVTSFKKEKLSIIVTLTIAICTLV